MILRTTRGVTPAEFKADWLDAQARQLGFDAWTVAYDEIDDRGFLR